MSVLPLRQPETATLEPMSDETFGERLKRLMDARGLKPTVLAARIGRSEGAIYKLLAGGRETDFTTGVRLARVLGVRADYLALGEGPMERTADAVKPPETEAVSGTGSRSAGVDPDVRQMSRDLKALAQEVRRLRAKVEPNAPPARRRAG